MGNTYRVYDVNDKLLIETTDQSEAYEVANLRVNEASRIQIEPDMNEMAEAQEYVEEHGEPNPAGEIADAATEVENAAIAVAETAEQANEPEIAEEVITEVSEGLADAAETISETAEEVEETAQDLSEETGDSPAAQMAEANAGIAANIAEDTEATANVTEAEVEAVAETETESDEPPAITHWYFRPRGRKAS
jgi:hypothetical protein